MNSRVTMGLAGLLLLGAIFVGYWGWCSVASLFLSLRPSPRQPPP